MKAARSSRSRKTYGAVSAFDIISGTSGDRPASGSAGGTTAKSTGQFELFPAKLAALPCFFFSFVQPPRRIQALSARNSSVTLRRCSIIDGAVFLIYYYTIISSCIHKFDQQLPDFIQLRWKLLHRLGCYIASVVISHSHYICRV